MLVVPLGRCLRLRNAVLKFLHTAHIAVHRRRGFAGHLNIKLLDDRHVFDVDIGDLARQFTVATHEVLVRHHLVVEPDERALAFRTFRSDYGLTVASYAENDRNEHGEHREYAHTGDGKPPVESTIIVVRLPSVRCRRSASHCRDFVGIDEFGLRTGLIACIHDRLIVHSYFLIAPRLGPVLLARCTDANHTDSLRAEQFTRYPSISH